MHWNLWFAEIGFCLRKGSHQIIVKRCIFAGTEGCLLKFVIQAVGDFLNVVLDLFFPTFSTTQLFTTADFQLFIQRILNSELLSRHKLSHVSRIRRTREDTCRKRVRNLPETQKRVPENLFYWRPLRRVQNENLTYQIFCVIRNGNVFRKGISIRFDFLISLVNFFGFEGRLKLITNKFKLLFQ